MIFFEEQEVAYQVAHFDIGKKSNQQKRTRKIFQNFKIVKNMIRFPPPVMFRLQQELPIS